MIRIGIFTDEISQDFEEAVKSAVENDIKNYELRGVWGKNVGGLSKEDVAKIKSIADDYGARVAVIGSPFLKCNLGNEEEYRAHVKILDNCIYQAHQYGARIIRVFTFWRLTSVEKYWDSIIGRLKVHVKKAEKEDIILAVETEEATNVGNCSEMRKLFDSLPSENLKATWDIANSYFGGETGYPNGYQLIRGEVVHVHLKDFVEDPSAGKHRPTYIGEGLIPYRDVFCDLLKDGFDGIASIESGAIHFKDKGKEAVSRQVMNLKKILVEVQGTYKPE
jgi:L-ribulose-5-phosphate 3-epimerase